MSEGYKETEGKLDYSEINLELLDLMAKRFNKNKDKYPPGNMKKPIPLDGLLWAIFRHTRKILQPIKGDPETTEDHLAAIGCNASMALDQLRLKSDNEVDLEQKFINQLKYLCDNNANDLLLGAEIRRLVK